MFDAIPTGLTETQRTMRSVVRDMARERIAPIAAEIDREDRFPVEAVEAMEDLGLFGLSVPEEQGGIGAGVVTECLVLEEISYALPAAALTLSPSIVSAHILLAAGEEAASAHLPRLLEPGTLWAVALTEPEAGSDSAAIGMTAQPIDGYRLSGTKTFVSNGSVADVIIVFARTGAPESRAHGITAFVVDADAPGLRVGRVEDKMGLHGAMTAELVFDDVHVSSDGVLGEVDGGFSYVMHAFDLSRPVIGAVAIGIARAALDAAAAYAAQREQFGRTVDQFQGVQFMLADMATDITAARALIYEVATLMDRGHRPVGAVAAMAKSYPSDVAMEVTTNAVQVLGGAGYTREFPVERMMRDAKLFQIVEGTNQVQRMIIGRHIHDRVTGRSP